MPKYFAKTEDIEKKKNAFFKKRTTNHWPCKTNLVSERPNTYGKELPIVLETKDPKLNEIGLSLVGLI